MPTNFDMVLRHKVVFTNRAVFRCHNRRLSRCFDALENVTVTSVCALRQCAPGMFAALNYYDSICL